MGEKKQSDVTDLHTYKFDPLPQDTEAGQTKSTPPRKRGRHKRFKKAADVIPAFLPERHTGDLIPNRKSEHWADSLSQAVSDETPEHEFEDDEMQDEEFVEIRLREQFSKESDDILVARSDDDDHGGYNNDPDEDEETDEPEPPLAAQHSDDGAEAAENLNDPELIGLLEQLSATIDNANQVLAETPGLNNNVAPDVTELMSEQPEAAPLLAEPEAAPLLAEPEAPQAWQQPSPVFSAPQSSRRLLPMLLTGALLFGAGAAGYWWFSSNSSFSGARKVETARIAASPESVSLKVPVPAEAVPVPLPARKPVSIIDSAEASTAPTDSVQVASLTEPTFFRNPDAAPGNLTAPASQAVSPAPPAAPALINEPPADDEVAAITEALSQTSAATPSVLRGSAGQPIALGLSAPVNHGDSAEVSVMIQGVPKAASLSTGSRIGGGTWVLDDNELDKLALLTGDDFAPGEFKLGVSFVKSDGKVPESRSITVVVEPVQSAAALPTYGLAAVNAGTTPSATASTSAVRGPAPGGTVPRQRTQTAAAAPQPAIPRDEEKVLLGRGRELLDLGDVSGARLILEHAARRGSKTAMVLLGNTYDPVHLNKLGVQGVQPDPDQASVWYERASRKADR